MSLPGLDARVRHAHVTAVAVDLGPQDQILRCRLSPQLCLDAKGELMALRRPVASRVQRDVYVREARLEASNHLLNAGGSLQRVDRRRGAPRERAHAEVQY